MENIFEKIEDNILEIQDNEDKDVKNIEINEETTADLSILNKKENNISKTELKSKRLSKLHLENPDEKEEGETKEETNDNDNNKNDEEDEYGDYKREDKTGIHFQIISNSEVSIEIVPEELLRDDVKSLILKYNGVYDENMKLWLVPYVNYELLYKELYQMEGISHKLHKVGSIAKECFEHKNLTTLIIKRKKKEEIIDYTNDTRERKIEQLPQRIQNALYDFQKKGINFGIEHHCRFLLADEMGVGKTIQAISLAYIYRDSWPVLIVCPGSMKYLWKGEIKNWLALKEHRINIINTSKQKISSEAYFYIISYDLVKNILKKLKQMTFDFVILDEAHSIKNRDSLRAKNILPIAIRAKRLILMTGTPLLAKPYEGYPLLYALRPDLFCYFKKFAYRYCDPQPTPFGINWSGTSNTKELHWILSTLMVRRLKRDVLNQLPPKRRQKIFIKTNSKVIEEIKLTRNIIKGRKGVLDSYTLTSKAKVEGVCEYISDILEAKEKFIVFAYHYEMLNSIESLMKEKNIEYIRIDGNTKQDRRYEFVRNFQQNENCKAAILSIIAASTGITLTSAHLVIFAELTWTPSIMIQAEDRAHRIGQKSDFVDIKYLYGPETLDDFILDRLQKKLTIVSTTLDDKKELLGVKADPNLIHSDGLNSKELLEYEKGDLEDIKGSYDEDEEKNLERKMINDLGINIVNKKKKTINKKKRKKRKNKKILRIQIDYSDYSSDVSNSSKSNFSITKDDKSIYPKGSKKSNRSYNSFSAPKKESTSKISGITELKKIWASENRQKSYNKNKEFKNKLLFSKEDFSKKSNSVIKDNKIIKGNNLNNVNNIINNISNKTKFKKDLFPDGKNVDPDYFLELEKSLFINLHKNNMRRNTQDEEKKNQIELIDKNKAKTKSFNHVINENMNENNIQNMKDKVFLI